MSTYLEKRFEGLLSSITECAKEDLEMLNHLSGKKAHFLRLSFRTVSQLMEVGSCCSVIVMAVLWKRVGWGDCVPMCVCRMLL